MELRILTVKEVLSAAATGIHKRGVWAAKVEEGELAVRRRRALRRLDRELEKGNCKAALSLMKQFKAHPAGFLRGFGAATATTKVPRSVSSSLQLVVDAILHSIKRSLEFQMQEEETEILPQDSGKMMVVDSCNSICEDRIMCVQHEAGHFLVGYMLGVLPRRYKIPSVEDLLQDKFARGKVEFVGFEFLREFGADHLSDRNFSKGKLNKETLTKFSCVTLGGLAAEHLLFGYAELLHSDVEKVSLCIALYSYVQLRLTRGLRPTAWQLDRVLKWLGFTENEVGFEHRRAAEATVLILSSHSEALYRLAEAMAVGRSVGFCIETIEHTLNFNNKL
ncbi:hypothetical protein C2S53_011536 [Perilla frutescens var. hirtella]|uniref:Uncharacterized protein n=1 Tax=Perilla frutescens var. hirtella TaxID=608512 RepID=A0AAD4J903_PERFH|nr:hypothetical protein C2S53_011536 [Perilla frutescens var. hirtella]